TSTLVPRTAPFIAWHTKKEVSATGIPPAPACAPVEDSARIPITVSTPRTTLLFTRPSFIDRPVLVLHLLNAHILSDGTRPVGITSLRVEEEPGDYAKVRAAGKRSAIRHRCRELTLQVFDSILLTSYRVRYIGYRAGSPALVVDLHGDLESLHTERQG